MIDTYTRGTLPEALSWAEVGLRQNVDRLAERAAQDARHLDRLATRLRDLAAAGDVGGILSQLGSSGVQNHGEEIARISVATHHEAVLVEQLRRLAAAHADLAALGIAEEALASLTRPSRPVPKSRAAEALEQSMETAQAALERVRATREG